MEKKQPTFGVWMEAEADLAGDLSPALRWNPSPFGTEEDTTAFSAPPDVVDEDGHGTAWAMMEGSFARFGGNRCCGWRPVLKRETEGKFEKLTLAEDFRWWTYAQLREHAVALARGMEAKCGLQKGDTVLIFAETQRDWIVAALACFRQG
ncbi:MAG: AMP-binding protein, partial [Pseudomonadota bacterium]